MSLMILIYTTDEVTATYSGQVSVKFLYIAFRNEINLKTWIMSTSPPYCNVCLFNHLLNDWLKIFIFCWKKKKHWFKVHLIPNKINYTVL